MPYSFFTEINYNSEDSIEITTTTKLIKITGRDLLKLYDFLAAYRVRYIQANIGEDLKDEGVFINEIIIEEIM